MPIQLINPDGLVEPQGYTQVAVATGSRMVFVAGQVGQDAEGSAVDGLAAQTAQALRNVGIALEAAGATFGDVVKTTVYVVDWRPEKMADLVAGLTSSQMGKPGPTTLIGVAALADPDLLVEIDVTAVTA